MAHAFYHADRARTLSEGQPLGLNANGCSKFGSIYFQAVSSGKEEGLSPAEQRELHLERIRREPEFSLYASRLECIFAAPSLEEAKWFAKSISPRPEHPIPIFEIIADRFWHLDMNWLDYQCSPEQQLVYYRNYWLGRITNHNPKTGPRRPPRIEVMIKLPAVVGKMMGYAEGATNIG